MTASEDYMEWRTASLSEDVFELRTSTRSEAFSLSISLDATECVFISVFTLIKTIPRKI